MDGFPSGQRGQTVNLLQIASVVRIHLHPLHAGVAELADAQDLKSCGTNLPYRFDSGRRHQKALHVSVVLFLMSRGSVKNELLFDTQLLEMLV